MQLSRAQILLEKSQHDMLTQIAQEENRSLSEIVREMIARELRYRQRHQILLSAHELQADYTTDRELIEFTEIDGDDFLFEDETHAEG